MQELFTVYGLERTIYRLSISKYVDNFTLKGGIFLYAVFDGNYARATTDIDFLAQKISNKVEDVKDIFTAIFSLEADDLLRFDLESLNVTSLGAVVWSIGTAILPVLILDKLPLWRQAHSYNRIQKISWGQHFCQGVLGQKN